MILRMDRIVLLSVTNGGISVILTDYHSPIPIYQKTSIYHILSKPISTGKINLFQRFYDIRSYIQHILRNSQHTLRMSLIKLRLSYPVTRRNTGYTIHPTLIPLCRYFSVIPHRGTIYSALYSRYTRIGYVTETRYNR